MNIIIVASSAQKVVNEQKGTSVLNFQCILDSILKLVNEKRQNISAAVGTLLNLLYHHLIDCDTE